MPLLSACQIPPPKNWQDFEDLCADLWQEEWKNNSIQRYGRNGQAQQGVDIVGRLTGKDIGGWVGIQCKCIEINSVLDKNILKNVIATAKNFRPVLSQYIVATTGRKDAQLEQLCRIISEEHQKKGLFITIIFGWEDIVLLLEKHPLIIAKHFPFLRRELTQFILSNENSDVGRYWQHLKYSFIREEYIHPLIIQELLGWLSDKHETIIAVDLTSANRSNRFSTNYSIYQSEEITWVHHSDKKGHFSYRHLGASSSGIHIIHCIESGHGSGLFNSLIFLILQTDTGIVANKDEMSRIETRERIILKTLGSISLGDHYSGNLLFTNGILYISKNKNPIREGDDLQQDILLEIK